VADVREIYAIDHVHIAQFWGYPDWQTVVIGNHCTHALA